MPLARRISRVTILSFFAGVACLGCARTTTGPGRGADPKKPQQDWLEDAIQKLRRAADPSGCHDALQRVERHLDGDADGKKEIQARSAALRRLQDRLGLDADEVDQVSGTAFGKLDGHHVALCLHLRDVAESLDLQGLPPVRQAEEAFAWVVRQVALRAGADEVLWPPEAVLQVGQGTGHERAMLFLALLQQLGADGIDGCMITLPGPEPGQDRYWIPGVLVGEGDKAEIYLFDTRLGVPVPGPGGKGVATLRQVKANPELLASLSPDKEHPYDVTPAEAARAEVRLVLPLSALAPRLLYLEEQMARRDRVRLAVDPAALLERFEKAAGGKVGVWNRPGQPGRLPPWTPTRARRLYLAPSEGGLERTDRWRAEQLQQLRSDAVVVRNYRDLIGFDDLPKDARDRLMQLAAKLFVNYAIVPHERLTRGRLDDATKRLTLIEGVLREFHATVPAQGALPVAAEEWRQRLREAYLALAHKERDADKRVHDLWTKDKYILNLTELTEEDDELPKTERQTLTFLVLGAVADPLGDDALFLLALCWQEKAARLRTELARGRTAGEPADPARQEALLGAWSNAEDLARQYAHQHPLGPDTVHTRLQAVLAPWRAGDRQTDSGVGLWDQLFRDFRRSATARLFHARALRQAGKETEARQTLRRLAEELATLRRDKELRDALDRCRRQPIGAFAQQQALVAFRLDRLARELGDDGGLAWLERAALLRAKAD
jgi:hypothetical protein